MSAGILLGAEGLDEACGCTAVTNWSEVVGVAVVARNLCEVGCDEDPILPGTFLVFLRLIHCAQIHMDLKAASTLFDFPKKYAEILSI